MIFISWHSIVLSAGNWDLGDAHSSTVLPGIPFFTGTKSLYHSPLVFSPILEERG